jgi:hypothetical protein
VDSYFSQSLQDGALDFSETLWINVFLPCRSTVYNSCWGHIKDLFYSIRHSHIGTK